MGGLVMGAEQSGFALKEVAEHAGEGEDEVAVGDGLGRSRRRWRRLR